MARDGRDSDRDEFGFVDRDDDRDDGLVDADYDDSFPGEPGEAMEDTPDPGYAAYAEEFEDPLADWPYPDKPLDGAPEQRRTQEPAAHDNRPGHDAIDSYAAAAAAAGEIAGGGRTVRGERSEDGREASDDRLQALDPTDAFPRETKPASTTASPEEEPLSSPAPERSDRDADTFDDAWLAADRDDAPLRADDPREEAPARAEAVSRGRAEEEDFIDDFLNDLDDVDETDTYRAAINDPREAGFASTSTNVYDVPGTGRPAPDSAAAQAGAAALAGAASMAGGNNTDRDAPMRSARDVPDEDSDGGSRLIPWVMVAVVVLALVLLAVGGYGVVKQRGELEAQIRDLQAQLATAVTTEEVEAERELQREVELENEALAAELEGLEAENAALAQAIASLEDRLETQEAEAAQEAQQAAEAAAAAQRAAAQQRESVAGSGRSAASAGPWFVNFGSYAQRDIAERWASRLEVDDGEVVVQSAEAAGRTLFRVRVIGLASRDRAERVATTLERQYQLPRLWVGRN